MVHRPINLPEGGECLFTHLPGDKMARRVGKAVESLGVENPWMMPMDASDDASMDEVFAKIESDHGQIDFVVHSIAYADKDWLQEGKFTATRDVYIGHGHLRLDAGGHGQSCGPDEEGGLDDLHVHGGAEKAVPGYNVMGVAKSALESSTRYLAVELGEKNIRVNSILVVRFEIHVRHGGRWDSVRSSTGWRRRRASWEHRRRACQRHGRVSAE